MYHLIEVVVDGAGFEPDHTSAGAPATIPIGNNRPRQS